jgi:hypothetical protein
MYYDGLLPPVRDGVAPSHFVARTPRPGDSCRFTKLQATLEPECNIFTTVGLEVAKDSVPTRGSEGVLCSPGWSGGTAPPFPQRDADRHKYLRKTDACCTRGHRWSLSNGVNKSDLRLSALYGTIGQWAFSYIPHDLVRPAGLRGTHPKLLDRARSPRLRNAS